MVAVEEDHGGEVAVKNPHCGGDFEGAVPAELDVLAEAVDTDETLEANIAVGPVPVAVDFVAEALARSCVASAGAMFVAGTLGCAVDTPEAGEAVFASRAVPLTCLGPLTFASAVVGVAGRMDKALLEGATFIRAVLCAADVEPVGIADTLSVACGALVAVSPAVAETLRAAEARAPDGAVGASVTCRALALNAG